jgi:hypothetical protein
MKKKYQEIEYSKKDKFIENINEQLRILDLEDGIGNFISDHNSYLN